MNSVPESPGRRVLVRPMYPDFLANKLFANDYGLSNRWIEPYVKLKELAESRGLMMDTWDLHPIESADVVLFLDLPSRPKEVMEARRRAPRAKFVLMLIESPLGRPHAFNRKNHDAFDAILTYNWRLCDEKRYFRYYLPLGGAEISSSLPYSSRKPLLMMNSNRLLGPLGMMTPRQSGLTGLPAIGHFFTGWSIALSAFFSQASGELYSRRRRLARLAEREFPGLLEIYGSGWQGEPVGWVSKLIKPKPFSTARGRFNGQKDDLVAQYRFNVAFENAVNDVGYISEKIFDPMMVGVVPLYLGDQRITEHVDADSFVDARNFDSDRELLTFVRNCPEAEWQKYRDAGRKYLGSAAAKKFQSDAFASRVVEVLEPIGLPSECPRC